MRKRRKLVFHRLRKGFTIIEVMIVLAIASLIMVIVFLSIASFRASARDAQRKEIAAKVYTALLEFKSRNGVFPACNNGPSSPSLCSNPAAHDNAARFLTKYIPQDADPSTGVSYSATSTADGPGNVHNQNEVCSGAVDNSTYYFYDSSAVDHSRKPCVGQILIQTGHWCSSTRMHPSDAENPISSGSGPFGLDIQVNKFVILVGLEKGEFYCLDNY